MRKTEIFSFAGVERYSRVLYLDCDIVITGDIREMMSEVCREDVLYTVQDPGRYDSQYHSFAQGPLAYTFEQHVELVVLTVFCGRMVNNMPPCHNAPKNSKSKPSTFTGNETSPLGVGYCAKYDKVGTKRTGRDGNKYVVVTYKKWCLVKGQQTGGGVGWSHPATTTATAGATTLSSRVWGFPRTRVGDSKILPTPTGRLTSRADDSKILPTPTGRLTSRADDDIHYLYKDKDCMILEPNDPAGVLIRTVVENPNVRPRNNGLLSLREVKGRGLSVDRDRSYLDDVIFFRPPNRYPVGENVQTIEDLFEPPHDDFFYLNVHPGHTNVFYQEYHAEARKDNPYEPSTKLADLLTFLAKRPGKDYYAYWTAPPYAAWWLPYPVQSSNESKMNLQHGFEVRVRRGVIPPEWFVNIDDFVEMSGRPSIRTATRQV
jgi:hypothetical protein